MGIGIGEDNTAVITVKKSDLLDALRKNYSTHRQAFLEAQEGFRASVIAELDKRLKDAREGRHIDIHIALVAPQDHTNDYVRIIRMLEMCTKDEIYITEHDFAQYVLDDWQWKGQFDAINAVYTGRRR